MGSGLQTSTPAHEEATSPARRFAGGDIRTARAPRILPPPSTPVGAPTRPKPGQPLGFPRIDSANVPARSSPYKFLGRAPERLLGERWIHSGVASGERRM
eukprot:7356-Chlamydomonas_euryale.AAC.2